MADSLEPICISVGPHEVLVGRDYPPAWDHYCRSASLIEDFGGGEPDEALLVAGVRTDPANMPELLLVLRYEPSDGGFFPGVLIVPETGIAFIGAGTTLLAYRVGVEPVRLWEDTALVGFWFWRRHDQIVLMSAEVELTAWDVAGHKLWSHVVEPPWSYEVNNGQVKLDVMDTVSSFGLREGPPAIG